MYSAPKIYDEFVLDTQPTMYHVRPIYGHKDNAMSDLAERQEKCLSALEELRSRLARVEDECSGGNPAVILDIVIGCSVGSPAVYLASVLAKYAKCSMKVFSHSSNTRDVDTCLTNKLLQINQGEYCGVVVIYKETTVPYFMVKPGRQIPVYSMCNILRYVSRDQVSLRYLYEPTLEHAAAVDSVLVLVDELEMGPSNLGQLLNKFTELLKSSLYLADDTFSIADIALCCSLLALEPSQIPNSLRSYLTECSQIHELSILKCFQ